jgi:hypothetical protein
LTQKQRDFDGILSHVAAYLPVVALFGMEIIEAKPNAAAFALSAMSRPGRLP